MRRRFAGRRFPNKQRSACTFGEPLNEPILTHPAAAASFTVLDVRVDAVQIPDVVSIMREWIDRRDACRFIAVTGMHGVTEAQHDAQFKSILNAANLLVPDGYPLLWLGRRRGLLHLKRRVYGPELMAVFCEQTAAQGYRHFFYGGAPGVAEDLARRFASLYPGLVVAGTYCPPFRTLTPEEDHEAIAAIEQSRADVVWVGLGTPKQESWMFHHRALLRVPVLIGVGAAFDLHTQRTAQAPRFMREHGFEWLFRLLCEPRRLWKRYLVYGSEFVLRVTAESLTSKNARLADAQPPIGGNRRDK
jgi:N-acetylglucosaminyldiphosphoundecaprenol N-acetyl-beta-D-mannosaminyltransferase